MRILLMLLVGAMFTLIAVTISQSAYLVMRCLVWSDHPTTTQMMVGRACSIALIIALALDVRKRLES